MRSIPKDPLSYKKEPKGTKTQKIEDYSFGKEKHPSDAST
jgi:hypothetical protein